MGRVILALTGLSALVAVGLLVLAATADGIDGLRSWLRWPVRRSAAAFGFGSGTFSANGSGGAPVTAPASDPGSKVQGEVITVVPEEPPAAPPSPLERHRDDLRAWSHQVWWRAGQERGDLPDAIADAVHEAIWQRPANGNGHGKGTIRTEIVTFWTRVAPWLRDHPEFGPLPDLPPDVNLRRELQASVAPQTVEWMRGARLVEATPIPTQPFD